MIYEMEENKIYSYIYDDYLKCLYESSREMLEKIVLFIREEVRKKFKSYIV